MRLNPKHFNVNVYVWKIKFKYFEANVSSIETKHYITQINHAHVLFLFCVYIVNVSLIFLYLLN